MASFKTKRRGKRSREQKNEQEGNSKYQDILIFGYGSKIFHDDVMAKYIDDEKHLIPWMGDETLMVDRYDCRGHLYSQEEFTCSVENSHHVLTPGEEKMENLCDEERYLALHKDLNEEEFLEEEERKRFKSQYDPTCSYSNVEFEYEEEAEENNSGDEEYDPSACLEEDEEEESNEDSSLMYQPAEPNSEKSKPLITEKVENENEQTGLFVKPDSLEVPAGMELPDSQKSHSIIEKTALFISKQGLQMEIVLKAKQAGNPQFDFLNYGNWLNPYYKLVLQKIRDGSYQASLPDSTNNEQSKAQPHTDVNSDQTDEDSDSSDDNEYIHPLLQAHRRPIKTTARPTPSTPSTTLSREPNSTRHAAAERANDPRTHWQRNGNPAMQDPSVSAAAVYMARKYENTKLAENSPLHDGTHEQVEEDNWADQLEEDRGFMAIDAAGFPYALPQNETANQVALPPSLAMMSLIPPPPPPGQSQSDDTMMAPGLPNMQFSSTLPPPPPPPGCSAPDLPTFSTQPPSHTRGYQTQQQQQQHIVPPPPDLKPVVDKLAEYVARNGEEFEGQIRMKRDPRFDFLMSDHIYYPYYLYKKQHKIAEITKKKAQEEKEKVERASKPLRFELKTKKKSKNVVQKSKTVEVFNETEEQEKDLDSFAEDELDGYRPNLVKKEKTPMEKAQIAMEQAKRMIAEVQQKQMLLKENAIFKAVEADKEANTERERQVQMERRRKAAAFIGMLKQSNTDTNSGNSSSSSDGSSDGETSNSEDSSDDADSKPPVKRHFQENLTRESKISSTKFAEIERTSSEE